MKNYWLSVFFQFIFSFSQKYRSLTPSVSFSSNTNILKFPLLKYLLGCISICISLSGCTSSNDQNEYDSVEIPSKPTRGDWVVIRLGNDATTLNPTNIIDETSETVSSNIFQSLLARKKRDNFDLIPCLAKERPKISNDGLSYTFEIRNEAKWDNSTPITGYDVLFSAKVVKIPQVNSIAVRSYLDLIKEIEVNPDTPKVFTVRLKEKYLLAESSLGQELKIFPSYIYDPENILEKYTLSQIESAKSQNDPVLAKFAEEYNSPKFGRDPKGVVGSGAYALDEWIPNQKIVLKRKKSWWGDAFSQEDALQAFPDQLVYKIIKDEITALTALKNEDIDVLTHIEPKKFIDLEHNKEILKKYHLSTEPTFAYSYFGMNCRPKPGRHPFFTDKNVRRAMAHLLNVDEIIQSQLFGLSERVVGPILPIHKKNYNDSLKPIPFNLNKAKELLDAAGWKDSDQDGIRDKIINGKKIPFEFDFDIMAGIELRKNVALVYQQNAAKAGIKINICPLEITVLFERQRERDFDMYYGAWASSPAPPDLKQIFHTESFFEKNGSNDVGFGNSESDRLINEIRNELNEEKRSNLYRKFQCIIYDEQPYVFFVTSQTPVIISSRFQNSDASAVRPNYYANCFWTPPSLIKYGKSDKK